jgi:hypothetical protein
VRPPQELPHAQAIRSALPDAGRHAVLFEEGHGGMMRELAEDVLGRLEPATQYLSGLVRADSVVSQRIEVGGKAMAAIEASPAAPGAVDQDLSHDSPLSVETETMRLESVVPDAVTSMSRAEATAMRPAWATEAADPAEVAEAGGVSPATTRPAPLEPAVPSLLVANPPVVRAAPVAGPPVVDVPVAEPPDVAIAPAGPPPAAPALEVRAVTGVAAPPPPPPTIAVADAPAPAPDGPAARPTASPAGPAAPQVPAQPPAAPAPVAAVSARNTTFVVTAQPTPAALVPKHGLDEERAWLHRTLSREYAAAANSVSRVLSEHPGFQGALEKSAGVLSDAVAIRLYLSGEGDGLDLPLRAGAVGPHVPFARCVVSGLSRLPSHRGATVFAASPTPQEWDLYRNRKFVTEWGFVNAFSAPCAKQRQGNDVDVLLWSMTARRTKLLEPELNPTADRVLFVPGTSFKVLELVEPAAGTRGRILLRELAAGEIDSSGRVDGNRASLDELALNSLRRHLDSWAEAKPEVRVTDAAVPRFGLLPGLVRTAEETR